MGSIQADVKQISTVLVLCCVLLNSVSSQLLDLSELSDLTEAVKSRQKAPTYANLLSSRTRNSKISIDDELRRNLAQTLTKLEPLLADMKESLPVVLNASGVRTLEANVGDATKCASEIAVIYESIKKFEIWAVQVLDSWGKPDTGLLRSYPNLASVPIFLGDFDECRRIPAEYGLELEYATLTIGINRIGPAKLPPNVWLPVALGLCLPDSCDADDIKNLANVVLQSIPNVTAGAYESNVQKRDIPLTSKAKAIIAVLSIFAALMVFGTAYDILVLRGWWRKLVGQPQGTLSEPVAFSSNRSGEYGSTGTDQNETAPLLNNTDVQFEEYRPNWIEKFFLSFSIMTNGEKILATKMGPGAITCINGIRFLSMSWVILGHSFVMGGQATQNQDIYSAQVYSRWTFEAILNALVSVDSFFTLSGLLMSYLVMKELEKKPLTPGFFAKFYFHRYWRLTPPYMLVLMAYVPLFKYLGDGPFWPQGGVEVDECEDTWWTNMLYVNNFVKNDKMCMGWSWYLANDMQFYVISPLIFLPLHYFKTAGLAVPLVMLLGNAITSGVTSSVNKLPPGIDMTGKQSDYMTVYYIKPYTRIGPYLVGMITGYLLNKYKCKMQLSKMQVMIGWAIAAAAALAVLYGPYDHFNGHPMSVDVAALYNSLHRIAWGGALSWVIFACACGYGGYVNTLLSWKAFIPLSRLTYCAYLVHILVIYYYLYSQRVRYYMNDQNVVFLFLSVLVMANMVAFVASLAFEAPFLGLEKILLAGVAKLVRLVRGSSRPDEFRDGIKEHKHSAQNGHTV